MVGFVEGVDRGQGTLFPALLEDYVADDCAWFSTLGPQFSPAAAICRHVRTDDDLLNLLSMAPNDNEAFKAAWEQDAEFFKRQPEYLSAQLHHGIGGSHLWFNYSVFENTKTFAATNDQPEFGLLRGIYPDSAIAHSHLFRRVHIPGIGVGEE